MTPGESNNNTNAGKQVGDDPETGGARHGNDSGKKVPPHDSKDSLKEKIIAAHRGGIKKVLIPKENEKDLTDIPENIKDKLVIKSVKWIDEIFETALEQLPVPLDKTVAAKTSSSEENATNHGELTAH